MKTPQLFSEKIFVGEMSWEDLSESRKNALSGEEKNRLMQHISRSNEQILAQYSPEYVEHLVSQAQSKKRNEKKQAQGTRAVFHGIPYVLACAACAVFVFTLAYTGRTQGVLTEERVKGAEPRIYVYKKTNEDILRLYDNAEVKENDILQVSYIAAGSSYGAIVSVDGNGVFTQHFPYEGSSSAELMKDGEIALDFAYQLDDAPEFERFLFITGNKPVSLDSLRTAFSRSSESRQVRKLNPADFLPRNTTITEFTLIKGDK
jgi:hypothetical protein